MIKNLKMSGQKIQNNMAMKNKKVGPDDFEILSLLGKGSFGEVYLVR